MSLVFWYFFLSVHITVLNVKLNLNKVTPLLLFICLYARYAGLFFVFSACLVKKRGLVHS